MPPTERPPTDRPPTERAVDPKQSRSRARRSGATGAQPEIVSSTIIKEVRPVIRPLTGQERRKLVALTAYYLAESRGFEPGHEAEDWAAAEARVRELHDRPA